MNLPPAGEYGVGMIFLPKKTHRVSRASRIERTVKAEERVVLGWRDVPVDHAMPISPTVKASEPLIRQIFIGRGKDIMVTDALERKLYVIRKTASHRIQALKLKHGKEYFVPSMSARTIVYKGLLLARRRSAEAVAADLSGPVGYRVVRQLSRAAGDGRLPARAR